MKVLDQYGLSDLRDDGNMKGGMGGYKMKKKWKTFSTVAVAGKSTCDLIVIYSYSILYVIFRSAKKGR